MSETTHLLRTSLYAVHQAEGAKIVEFGGWEMPVEYAGIKAEHLAVRSAAGLFDLSHMGEIEVRGPEATAFVNRLVTNDVSRLADGQAQYTCMCRPDGGILDDLLVYRFHPHKLWLVVNASNRQKIADWLQGHLPAPGVEVEDLSLATALVAVQGPKAQEVLQPLTRIDLAPLGYYRFTEGEVAGIPALVSRTGYTGEDGFEVYVAWDRAPALWQALRPGVEPVGLGARDTLRLESGYALYGHEIDEDTTPLQAGLAWVVKLDKPDFIGREALVEQKAEGPDRTVVGLEMEGRAIPRQGYPVEKEDGPAGRVTSGTFSPSLSRGIALASVEVASRLPGTQLYVNIRGRREKARVVRPPFVAGSVRRS